jgi:hypothetical protein
MNRFRNLRARLNNMNGLFALLPNPLTRVELPDRTGAVSDAREPRDSAAGRTNAPPVPQSSDRPRS